jgi:hypothetical protein
MSRFRVQLKQLLPTELLVLSQQLEVAIEMQILLPTAQLETQYHTLRLWMVLTRASALLHSLQELAVTRLGFSL